MTIVVLLIYAFIFLHGKSLIGDDKVTNADMDRIKVELMAEKVRQDDILTDAVSTDQR